MGRETEDERADRRRRAGRRLRGWRDGARIHQRDMAERLGVAQQTYSQYERGLLQIPYEFAEQIAKILGMPEPDVWRGLEMPLPREFETDADVVAWALRNAPEEYERWLRRLRGNPATRPVDKPNDVTRKGGSDSEASPPEEPAV